MNSHNNTTTNNNDNVQCKETWEMDASEKLEQSELFKEKGTKFFKVRPFSATFLHITLRIPIFNMYFIQQEGKYKIAVKHYKKIVETLKSEESLEGDEATKRTALLLAGHLNEAACHLKLAEDLEALHAAEQALLIEPNNHKGLFRMASVSVLASSCSRVAPCLPNVYL